MVVTRAGAWNNVDSGVCSTMGDAGKTYLLIVVAKAGYRTHGGTLDMFESWETERGMGPEVVY